MKLNKVSTKPETPHLNLTCIVRPGVCGPPEIIRPAAAIPCGPPGPTCCCIWEDCGESPSPGTFAAFDGVNVGVTTGLPMMGIPPVAPTPLDRAPDSPGAPLTTSLVVLTTGRPIVRGIPPAAAAAAAALP